VNGQAPISKEHCWAELLLWLSFALGLLMLMFSIIIFWRLTEPPSELINALKSNLRWLVFLFYLPLSLLYPEMARLYIKWYARMMKMLKKPEDIKPDDDTDVQRTKGSFWGKTFINKHNLMSSRLKRAILMWHVSVNAQAVFAAFLFVFSSLFFEKDGVNESRFFFLGTSILAIILVEGLFWRFADRKICEYEANPNLAEALRDIETNQDILLRAIQTISKNNRIIALQGNAKIVNSVFLAWDTFDAKTFAEEVISKCMQPSLEKYFKGRGSVHMSRFTDYCKPLFDKIPARICTNMQGSIICQQTNHQSCLVLNKRKDAFDYKNCPNANPHFIMDKNDYIELVKAAAKALEADRAFHDDLVEQIRDHYPKPFRPNSNLPEPPQNYVAVTVTKEQESVRQEIPHE